MHIPPSILYLTIIVLLVIIWYLTILFRLDCTNNVDDHDNNIRQIDEDLNTKINEGNIISYDMVKTEYDYCHNMIIKNIDIIEKTEIVVLTGISLIYYYSRNSKYMCHHLLMPNLFSLTLSAFMFFRYVQLDNIIGYINDYMIDTFENKFIGIGFTNYYKNRRTGALGRSHLLLWGFVFIILTIITVSGK